MVTPCRRTIGVLRVLQQHAVRVGMGVDEAGSHSQAGGVQYPPGLGAGQVADGLDGLTVGTDVRPVSRRASAINDCTACNDQVEQKLLSLGVRSFAVGPGSSLWRHSFGGRDYVTNS